MASRLLFSPDDTLADMPPWAVTFRLPKVHLDRMLVTASKAGGRPADLVSIVVLHLVPDAPMGAALSHRRLKDWDDSKETLYVRVPPPISWRLNRLVEQTLAIDPDATRSRLLAAGAERAARTSKRQLVTWREAVGALRAQDAALADGRPDDVLQQRRPRAGRRTSAGRASAHRATKERRPKP